MRSLLSIPETAAELGICRASVYKLISAEKLPTVKLGRRRFVRSSDLAQFLEELSDERAA